MNITRKDWNRMLDLVLAGKTGSTVASSIKQGEKAAARFICGLKLSGLDITYDATFREPYRGQFSEFGNKALQLGITHEKIASGFERVRVPIDISEKLKDLSSKKLSNRFVGDISKALLNAGCNVEYLPHNGNAITQEGRYAMEQNGRKWTIGYRLQIDVFGTKATLVFDAITCEGGGSTLYTISGLSSGIFNRHFSHYTRYGKREFIKTLLTSLHLA